MPCAPVRLRRPPRPRPRCRTTARTCHPGARTRLRGAGPATPVSDTRPNGVASPKTCVSRSTSPSTAPPCTRASRRPGSTRTPRMADRSMSMPSRTVDRPATEWPSPRTATSSPWSRAKFTASTTSAVPAHRTVMAGRSACIGFHTGRGSVWASSEAADTASCPRNWAAGHRPRRRAVIAGNRRA